MSSHSWRPAIGALAVALTCGGFVSGSQEQAVIRVDDPRPLSEAVAVLEKRHGWRITYEDPQLVNSNEIVDLTSRVRKSPAPDGRKVFGAIGGPFEFTYTRPSIPGALRKTAILQALIARYQQTGYPAVFRLIETGDVAHIVPAMRTSATGVLEPVSSILDTTITIPDGERSLYEMCEAVVAGLKPHVKGTFGLGMIPTNLFLQRRVRGGATNETARSVMLRVFESSGRKLSWRLLHDPSPPGSSALNIHIVSQAELAR
jgi:hypothetical protein